MKTVLISLVVSAAMVLAAFAVWPPITQIVKEVTVGASTDFTQWTHFYDNVNIGGNRFATSSRGSVTYTAASIVNSRLIEHNAEAATTATLPTNAALSAAGFLPNVGDTQSVFIHASTTLITLAGSTGVTLASASTTKNISAGNIGRLECVRLGSSEARLIQCLLTQD